MPDNTGYINVVAVMQKFFDQAISGNWSYNPEHYPDNEVPVSVMANDFLTTYKYGGGACNDEVGRRGITFGLEMWFGRSSRL